MEINFEEKKYDVSVILTLFNSKSYFKRAIDSVLNQTFKNYELVIVDDGSTDDIESELFHILKDNDNFKYIRHSNRKHPLSLNRGILNASADLITFLDSDDEYKSNHIDQRVNFFSENSEIDLIYSPAILIGNENDFYIPDAEDNSKLIHINDCIIGGTFFGKRKVFEELNGFKNIYAHDFDFYKRAVKKFKVKRFDSPTYIYHRDNPDSTLSKMKETAYEQ